MNELLRSEFDCNELPEKSYLMFEGIMRINRNQISNLFKVKKQRIELNNSTKEWLKKEALAKYTKLFE